MISFVRRNDITNAEGQYAIRMRVCKNRLRKYFTLKIFADKEFWDEDNECFVILKNLRDKRMKNVNNITIYLVNTGLRQKI